MNQHILIFSRAASYTVKKALVPSNNDKSSERAQVLINNMNLINQSLIKMAIKMLNKVKNSSTIDKDELTQNLHDVIYISVMSYAKRAY